jgi:hypothetical protein
MLPEGHACERARGMESSMETFVTVVKLKYPHDFSDPGADVNTPRLGAQNAIRLVGDRERMDGLFYQQQ